MERMDRHPGRLLTGVILGAAMLASVAIPASAAGSTGRVTLKTCYDAGASVLISLVSWRQPYFVSYVAVELLDASTKLVAIDQITDTPSLEGSVTLHPATSAATLASVATVRVSLSGKGGETQLIKPAPRNGFKSC